MLEGFWWSSEGHFHLRPRHVFPWHARIAPKLSSSRWAVNPSPRIWNLSLISLEKSWFSIGFYMFIYIFGPLGEFYVCLYMFKASKSCWFIGILIAVCSEEHAKHNKHRCMAKIDLWWPWKETADLCWPTPLEIQYGTRRIEPLQYGFVQYLEGWQTMARMGEHEFHQFCHWVYWTTTNLAN